MKERHPEELRNSYLSIEQFRPNIVIDVAEPYAEDRHKELRIGSILLRHAGPTHRCSFVRMNLEKHCFVDGEEPYSTLASYRTIPGSGVMFGNYY